MLLARPICGRGAECRLGREGCPWRLYMCYGSRRRTIRRMQVLLLLGAHQIACDKRAHPVDHATHRREHLPAVEPGLPVGAGRDGTRTIAAVCHTFHWKARLYRWEVFAPV